MNLRYLNFVALVIVAAFTFPLPAFAELSACQRLAKAFGPTEAWIYIQSCKGERADLNKKEFGNATSDHPDPGKPEQWRDKDQRRVSAKFIETITLDPAYAQHIHRRGVRIAGVLFNEPIDLSVGAVSFPLSFFNSRFEKGIDLTRFKGRGVLAFVRSRVVGPLLAANITMDGDLLLSRGSHFDAIDLAGANISGQIDMSGARVEGKLVMTQMKVGRELLLRGDGERQLYLGGDLLLFNTTVGDEFDLYHVKAGPEVEEVDLTNLVVKAEMQLWNPDVNEYVDTIKEVVPAKNEWGRATLILSSASVGPFQDHATLAWPQGRGQIELTGFSYSMLGGLGYGPDASIAFRSDEWINGWLALQSDFSPQPYRELSSTLTRLGYATKARNVLYAMKDRMLAEEENWLRWLWLLAHKAFIGYGLQNWQAGIWMFFLVITGMAALRISGEGKRIGMGTGFEYSLDMILPVVKLRALHENDSYDLNHPWARRYFYFHKIMAYALALFLVAGLSGLAK